MKSQTPPFAITMHIEGHEKPITNYMSCREGAEQEMRHYKEIGRKKKWSFIIEPYIEPHPTDVAQLELKL